MKNFKIYNRLSLVFLILIMASPSWGKISPKKIKKEVVAETQPLNDQDLNFEFKDHSVFIKIKKVKNKFSIIDQLGPRSLEIKSCNSLLIQNFVQEILTNIKNLQTSQSENSSENDRWVKFEGVQFPVLTFEPAFSFFHKLSNRSHILFMESRRLCKK